MSLLLFNISKGVPLSEIPLDTCLLLLRRRSSSWGNCYSKRAINSQAIRATALNISQFIYLTFCCDSNSCRQSALFLKRCLKLFSNNLSSSGTSATRSYYCNSSCYRYKNSRSVQNGTVMLVSYKRFRLIR